jgi:hypothetical protein
MTQSNTILIIFAIAATALCFTDADDLNRLSLVMRQEDVLRVDMRKLISFKGSSINFFSNNPAAKLPGVTAEPPVVFEKDKAFTPIILKNKKGRIYVVQSGRKSLEMWDHSERNVLNPVPFTYKFQDLPGVQVTIADIHLEENSLTVLFYDLKDQTNPDKKPRSSKYYLMNVNLDNQGTEKIVSFEMAWIERPALKLFSPHPTADARDFIFLIFNKEVDADALSDSKSFTLVKVNFLDAAEIIPPTNIVRRMLTELLFRNEPTPLRLKNVLISTSSKHSIFFVVQDPEAAKLQRHRVYWCAVNVRTDEVKDSTFSNCELFKKTPVKQFFLKGKNFVSIADGNKMEFCDFVKNSCREGVVQDTWELKSVTLENDVAVIIMAIEKTKFIFIRDFKESTLVWYYDDKSPVLPAYLAFGSVEQQPHTFLVEIPPTGLSFRDITFDPFFEIKGAQLKQDQQTNVYLEDKLVLSYDLKPLGEKKVQNLQEDRVVEVLSEPKSGEFHTKIDVIGSNLLFEENGSRLIKYFNPMRVGDGWNKAGLENQLYYFHNEWAIYPEAILKLSCEVDKDDYTYSCKEVDRIKSPRQIKVREITTVEEMGKVLVILSEKSENIVILNREENRVLDFAYPERFNGGHTCMYYLFYIACAYPVTHKSITVTSIRLFWVKHDRLEEVAGFEETFLESVIHIWEKSSFANQKIDHVNISSFDFDDVQTEKLSVLFIFVFDTNFLKGVYAHYDFNQPTNPAKPPTLTFTGRDDKIETQTELTKHTKMIVLDSQTVLYAFETRFDLYCFENDSKYYFEYLDMVALHSVKLVSTHSLVVVVFQGQQQRHFFAIFKITQNAAKQLLHLEEIAGYTPDYTLSTITIDDQTMGFYQYAPTAGTKLPSYMYFRNGPILVSSTYEHNMVVNGAVVSLNFAQDRLFDVARSKSLKSSHFTVNPESRPLDVPLKNHFTFDGNMADITVDQSAQELGVTLRKPLMVASDDDFVTFAQETTAEDVTVAFSESHILVQENRHVAKYQLFARGEEAKWAIDFTGATKSCDEVILSESHVLCFWTDVATPMLSKWSIRNAKAVPKAYILSEPMSMVRVLLDSATKLTLIYRDVAGKYVCWFELNNETNAITRRIIGKAAMSVDDLNVLDFYSNLDESMSRLTIIILDGHSNQLLFYLASTMDYSQEPVLKRSVSLNRLDNEGHDLSCRRTSATELKFNCMLLTRTRLIYLKIAQANNADVSLFTWEVSDTRKFYNVLFATTLDSSLNMDSIGDFRNFFIHQKDITTTKDPMIIRYSLADPQIHHCSFAFQLAAYKPIVAILPNGAPENGDIEQLEVYHLVGKTLKKLVLKVGDYHLHHSKPFQLDGKKVTIHPSFFNNNPSDVSFSFAQRKTGADEDKKQRNIKLVGLIVGVIVLSLLILIALFALLVLLRDRKKIQLGANQPTDETEVDISYM